MPGRKNIPFARNFIQFGQSDIPVYSKYCEFWPVISEAFGPQARFERWHI